MCVYVRICVIVSILVQVHKRDFFYQDCCVLRALVVFVRLQAH